MKLKSILTLATLATCQFALAAIPTAINYQGRLTDSDGNPASGTKVFGLEIYDAQTGGNAIYSETIGSVAIDANGIYNFQFGTNGSSVVSVSETLAVGDGSSATFVGTPSSSPRDGTLSVSDETFSWNEADGNPGERATASAVITSGFITDINLTNGGSGYADPPAVEISGDGTGAIVTAVVTDGSVSFLIVENAGSGYSEASVSIEEPPAPFVVVYSSGTISVSYESAPATGTEIVASYQANEASIRGAFQTGEEHWLELSIDGQNQATRERVLSVPFALHSFSSGTSLKSRKAVFMNGWRRGTGEGVTFPRTFIKGTDDTTEIGYLLQPNFDLTAITGLEAVMKEVEPTIDSSIHVRLFKRGKQTQVAEEIARVVTNNHAEFFLEKIEFVEALDWENYSYFMSIVFPSNPGGGGTINSVSLTFEHQE